MKILLLVLLITRLAPALQERRDCPQTLTHPFAYLALRTPESFALAPYSKRYLPVSIVETTEGTVILAVSIHFSPHEIALELRREHPDYRGLWRGNLLIENPTGEPDNVRLLKVLEGEGEGKFLTLPPFMQPTYLSHSGERLIARYARNLFQTTQLPPLPPNGSRISREYETIVLFSRGPIALPIK